MTWTTFEIVALLSAAIVMVDLCVIELAKLVRAIKTGK